MSNISVDYDVLNQRGSPAWFSDIYANIPTAGYKGRMFISIDTYAFYRDTGTGWDLIGGPGTGTITGSGATGQVSFFNGASTLAGSNNLFWDNTNGRLGIGTATPGQSLDIHASGTIATFNGIGTSNAFLVFQNAGSSKWSIGNIYNAGANSFSIYNNGLTTNAISIQSSSNDITLTGNLNNGVKVITTGAIVSNSILSVINNGSVTGTNGYSSFSGNLANNGFTFAPNNTNYLRFITPTTANYDYTFPATTGTIALTSNLSSYVPYTGATTNVDLGVNDFTSRYVNSQFAFIQGNGTMGGVLGFTQYATSYTSTSNCTDIYALGNNKINFSFYQIGGAFKIFNFDVSSLDTTNTRAYTLPNASGTLALTSDLSSYLPLTGGTLTGQLYINPTNTAIVGLDVASNKTIFRSDNLEGFKRQLEITMGSGTLVQLTAKGYGANYGTDLAFYTATTGGTNASPGIYITGTNNRVGIKTGTPAYDLDVSGGLRSTTDSYLATTSGNLGIGSTTIYNGGGFGKVISFYDATSLALTYVTNTQQYQVGIASNDYRIYDFTGSTYRFAIKGSTGNVIIDGTTDNGEKLQINGGVSYTKYFLSSAGYIGIGNQIQGGWTANDMLLLNNNSGGKIAVNTTNGVAYNGLYLQNGAVAWITISDERLKTDLIPINNALHKIEQLRTFTGRYKTDNIGFSRAFLIAQDVLKVLPEAVDIDNDEIGTLGIKYTDIIPLLVASIKELNEKLIRNNIN